MLDWIIKTKTNQGKNKKTQKQKEISTEKKRMAMEVKETVDKCFFKLSLNTTNQTDLQFGSITKSSLHTHL